MILKSGPDSDLAGFGKFLNNCTKKKSNCNNYYVLRGVLERGGLGGRGSAILILQEIQLETIILKHHTKFQHSSSKRSEEIPS